MHLALEHLALRIVWALLLPYIRKGLMALTMLISYWIWVYWYWV